jgi:hypothetical protein
MVIKNNKVEAAHGTSVGPKSEKRCVICEDEKGTYEFRGKPVCQRCISTIKKED